MSLINNETTISKSKIKIERPPINVDKTKQEAPPSVRCPEYDLVYMMMDLYQNKIRVNTWRL